jgi:hypothetical protein
MFNWFKKNTSKKLSKTIEPDTGDSELDDFLLEHNHYSLSSELLIGNSANCKYTDLIVYEKTNTKKEKTITYFLKFQVNPSADNLNIDVINNEIINKFINKDSRFTKFIGLYSVNIYTKQDNINIISNSDIKNYFFLTPPALTMSSVFIKKDDPVNLNIQEKLLNAKECSLSNINDILNFDEFRQLFQQMYALGKYGFSHNDAHLSNLMISNNKIYLIDYGRVRFNQITIAPYKHRLSNLSYKKNLIFKTPTDDAFAFMFDISTICMNIICRKLILFHNKPILLESIEIKTNPGYYGISEISITFKDLQPNQTINKNIILNYLLTIIQTTNKNNINKLLLIGLYWFIDFVTYFQNLNTLNNYSTISINFDDLIYNKYMYSYFQYTQLPTNYKCPPEPILNLFVKIFNNTHDPKTTVIINNNTASKPNMTPIQRPQPPPTNYQPDQKIITRIKRNPSIKKIMQNIDKNSQEKYVNEEIENILIKKLKKSLPRENTHQKDQLAQVQQQPLPQLAQQTQAPQQQALQPQQQAPQQAQAPLQTELQKNLEYIDSRNKIVYQVIIYLIHRLQTISFLEFDLENESNSAMNVNSISPNRYNITLNANTKKTFNTIKKHIKKFNHDKNEIELLFIQWVKEKTILYLKDLYTKIQTVQNILQFMYAYCPTEFQLDDIHNNLIKILNSLYDTIDTFYQLLTDKPNHLVQILLNYEDDVVGKLFVNMQNYIDTITSNPYIQQYFIMQPYQHQQGGELPQLAKFNQAFLKRGFRNISGVNLPLEKDNLTEKKKKAMQKYTEHLICGYESPPSQWVYEELAK